MIELSGGEITFTSQEEQGSTFEVIFPLSEVKHSSNIVSTQQNTNNKFIHQQPQSLPENIETPHVLIVEDNNDLRSYLKKELDNEYKIYTAKDGKRGIEKAIENVPDLIITDWLMPNKNGIELCEEIKSNTITSHIPVIMLTAKTEVEDKIKSFETGADTYFSKPFEMEVLKVQIKNLIKQRKKIFEKLEIGEPIANKNIPERDLKFWNKVKETVEKNISNSAFNVQDLADKMFVSRMQLNRKLKALADISGSTYITGKRMNLAKELLKNKNLQISEVASQTGYDNAASFTRAFKKHFGKLPSDRNY